MPVLGGTTTLPDGVVTLPKLGFDVATQVELDAVEAGLEAEVDALDVELDAKADATALAGKLDTGGTAANSVKVGGVAVTGTPSTGQVPTATGPTAATWTTPASLTDATTGAKGVVQLAGDLAGTATSPTVPGLASRVQIGGDLAGTPTAPTVPGLAAKADATATTTALAGKVPTTRTVTAGTGLTGGGDLTADRTLAVAYGTTSTTAARGDDSRITGAAQRAGAVLTGTWDFTGATVTGVTAGGYTQVVDVRTQGTVGAGNAGNDTAALNAALTAAGAGGAVFIPAGVTLQLASTVTVDSRAITGRGTLLATSLTTALTMQGTRPALEGVRLIARGCTNGIDVAANTTGLSLDRAVLGGDTTNQPGQAVHFNATGIVGARITNCLFTHCIYAVLTDQSATDLRDLRMLGNRFEECGGGTGSGGDAIELNHPGSAFVGAASVVIDGNFISCANGDLSTGGFGVGIAGATRVIVSNNTFDSCRVQAVHIEDEAAHVTVTGNSITGGGVGIYVLGGDHLLITDNQIYGTAGAGIQFAQTTSPFNSWGTYWRVADNIINGCGSHGIDINIDYDVNGAIEGNLVTGCTGDGLWVHSTGTAVATGPLAIRANEFTGNTGWGMTLDSHLLQTVAGNMTVGNGAGPFLRAATTNGILIPVHDASAQKLDAAFTTNSTGWVTMFPAGVRATGSLVVSAARLANSADRCQQVWTLTWDGTTTTPAVAVGGEVSNGGMTGCEVRVNSGNLQVRVGHSGVTDGSVVRVWAQMQGVLLL